LPVIPQHGLKLLQGIVPGTVFPLKPQQQIPDLGSNAEERARDHKILTEELRAYEFKSQHKPQPAIVIKCQRGQRLPFLRSPSSGQPQEDQFFCQIPEIPDLKVNAEIIPGTKEIPEAIRGNDKIDALVNMVEIAPGSIKGHRGLPDAVLQKGQETDQSMGLSGEPVKGISGTSEIRFHAPAVSLFDNAEKRGSGIAVKSVKKIRVHGRI
jgi:hypothetical protein